MNHSRWNGSEGYLVSFVLGFVVRVIPEAIAYPAPIGYNTAAYYAPALSDFRSWGAAFPISLFYPPQFSPLVYLLMIPPSLVLGSYTALAISAPVLHGVLAVAVYHYLKRVLGFARHLALLGAFFVAVQYPVLRLSADMFSESLGISIGLFTLSLLITEGSSRKYFLVALMLVVTGLAHQTVLLTLLPCVFICAARTWLRDKSKSSIRLLLSSAPALILLGWNWSILQGAPAAFPVAAGVRLWFLWSSAASAGISPFANYLVEFASYPKLALTILGFLLFLYAPLAPLLLQKTTVRLTDAWATFMLLLTVSPLISPRFAFDLWYLWAITLSVPMSIIAFKGFARVLRNARTKQMRSVLVILILAPYVVIGTGYMTLPPDRPFIYFANPLFLNYMPSSMLANTVPLQDSLDALALLKQLNSTMDQTSVLLVHEAFYGFAAVSISGPKNIINYHLSSVVSAASYAKQLGFSKIYWIWWIAGYGWHGLLNPPPEFSMTSQSGRIAIYLFSQ